jgi:integrase
MAVQFIRDRNKKRWYVYAWKGGPRIRVHEGPRKPTLTAADHKKIAAAIEQRTPGETTLAILRAWEASPEWTGLEPSTQRVWRTSVARIEEKWGKFPMSIWHDPRMTAKVIDWRNKFAATPRTADIQIGVLRTWLKWARLRGHTPINVAEGIPTLYRGANREEIIWLPEDVESFAAACERDEVPHVYDGLRLAMLTGLRRSDLVSLSFAHVGEFAVSKVALKKSRGRRRKATIPMTDDLEALLAELRTRYRAPGVDTVLVNSFGRPWTPSGFGGSFNRVRDAAGIQHVDDEGEERTKHLHDVRGTFCTMLLAECDLTDEQAASIMGWSPARVGNIRRTYVDDAQVVVAIGKRIAARAIAKHGAKQ